jgi:16S rRNA (guanine527-N7)-methyltransferase
MEISHIADLLLPFAELADEELRATSIYIDVLLKWNARISLTAVQRPEEIVTRHFGESFFVAQKLLPKAWQGGVIDFGSGPGFPGIPMAMSRPLISMTLIESNGKKATFLSEVISQLEMKNVTIFRGRGEAFGCKAELVVMRAVEKFQQAMAVASELVSPGGRLVLLVSQNQVEVARELQPKFQWETQIPIPLSNSRVLLVGNL